MLVTAKLGVQRQAPHQQDNFSGPHKLSEEKQAAQQFGLLLQVVDQHWQAITAW